MTPVLTIKSPEVVYDYSWFPKMSSLGTFFLFFYIPFLKADSSLCFHRADQASSCFISCCKDTPINLWDAFTGHVNFFISFPSSLPYIPLSSLSLLFPSVTLPSSYSIPFPSLPFPLSLPSPFSFLSFPSPPFPPPFPSPSSFPSHPFHSPFSFPF